MIDKARVGIGIVSALIGSAERIKNVSSSISVIRLLMHQSLLMNLTALLILSVSLMTLLQHSQERLQQRATLMFISEMSS